MAAREERHLQKRKKAPENHSNGHLSKKRHLEVSNPSEDIGREIEDLETQILKSQKNYNKINDLLKYAKEDTPLETQRKAWLALCTIFSHLLADGKLPLDGSTPGQDGVIGRWLMKRYQQYYEILHQGLIEEFGVR